MGPDEKKLVETIEAAARAVEAAQFDKRFEQAAFDRVLAALLSGSESPQGTDREGPVDIPVASSEAAAAAAARLKVSPNDLERCLEFDDDGVHIIASRSEFDSAKSVATQEIALLVAGGRQAAKLDEWTSLNSIRAAAEDLGVDDRANFALHIKNLSGVRQRGVGRTGEIKVNSVGFEKAKAIIERLAEDQS